jgi:hypothetical protein
MAGIALTLFFSFLFVAMFLALLFAYQSTEKERKAREEGAGALAAAIDVPRFFAHVGEDAPAVTAGYAGYVAVVVREMEQHIRRERETIAGFVSEPSVERLFGTAVFGGVVASIGTAASPSKTRSALPVPLTPGSAA